LAEFFALQQDAEETGALQIGERLVAETNQQSLIGALFQRVLELPQFRGLVQRAAVDGDLQHIQSFETAGEEMIQTEIAAGKGNDGSVVTGDVPATYVPQ